MTGDRDKKAAWLTVAGQVWAIVLAACLCLGFLAGCHHWPTPEDLSRIPQNMAPLGREAAWRVKPAVAARLARAYLSEHYSPWQRGAAKYGPRDLVETYAKVAAEPGWGANMRRHGREWLDRLERLVDLNNFRGRAVPGITLARVNLRLLPTENPDFFGIRAGGGFPFDRLQQTALHPGTPLLITHRSADRSWLWVESGVAAGWLPADKAAPLGAAPRAHWRSVPLLTILRDDTPLYGSDGRFLFKASIGALFPLLEKGPDHYLVLAPRPGPGGQAELAPAVLAAEAAAPWPLPLSSRRVAAVAQGMLGVPYGWGGLYGWRDCSAATKDLFAVFGLWLDRNSGDQAKNGARYLDLSGASPADKGRLIRAHAVPLASLLWLPGHIMLFAGQSEGEFRVWHAVWGVRTWGPFRGEGRAVVGQTALTSLNLGMEIPGRAGPEEGLLARVRGLVLLLPEKGLQAD